MRTLEEISEDYWKADAEYSDYVEVIHPQRLNSLKQKSHDLFEEFAYVKVLTDSKEELVDSNPYALYGYNPYRRYR